MLNTCHRRLRRLAPAGTQGGLVLLVSLVLLVVMALASVALMRSVATANIIAGNLAFQQAATTSADQATELAIAWLEANSGQAAGVTVAGGNGAVAQACATGKTVLACNQDSLGYIATRQDPTNAQSWSDLWAALATAGHRPVSINQGEADHAGNTMSYFIQRMCSAEGDASIEKGCTVSPASTDTGTKGVVGLDSKLEGPSQVYYRITVKVEGPRNTVSFTQAMAAL